MTIIWCMVLEIWSTTDKIFCHSGPFFALPPPPPEFLIILDHFYPFTLVTTWKIKILKNWKISLEILSFYTCVPQMTNTWCIVPEIWSMTGRILGYFGSFFTLLPPPPLTTQKIKILKKWKKHLRISSFTCVPKIMIRWYTVPEKWCTAERRMEKVTHRGGCPTQLFKNNIKNSREKTLCKVSKVKLFLIPVSCYTTS